MEATITFNTCMLFSTEDVRVKVGEIKKKWGLRDLNPSIFNSLGKVSMIARGYQGNTFRFFNDVKNTFNINFQKKN